MVPCPSCGENKSTRDTHALPVVRDGAVYRKHVCLGCRHRFVTAQRVVTEADLSLGTVS
jgi:transcriptional regulator NrdR family protein